MLRRQLREAHGVLPVQRNSSIPRGVILGSSPTVEGRGLLVQNAPPPGSTVPPTETPATSAVVIRGKRYGEETPQFKVYEAYQNGHRKPGEVANLTGIPRRSVGRILGSIRSGLSNGSLIVESLQG